MNEIFGDIDNIPMVYIWSNGSPHKKSEEYKKAITKTDFISNSIHVMINSCVPLMTFSEKFIDSPIFSFYRVCSKEVDPYEIHGSKSFWKFRNTFEKMIMITKDSYVDITGMKEIKPDIFIRECSKLPSLGRIKTDNFRLFKEYPKKKIWNVNGFCISCYVK